MCDEGNGTRNIKLIIAYDGTEFCGWQRQGKETQSLSSKCIRTVQGELEQALEKLHKHPVRLTGSGRTDSGVHAAGQCANFFTDIKSMEAPCFVPALNSLLSKDIRIIEARETLDDFHARFDAKSRTYRYYIKSEALPWERRYCLPLRRRPALKRLNEMAALLRGETDCSVFAAAGDKSKSRHRYIFNAAFFTEADKIVFEISANAFLWMMVRSILGTILRCEKKGLGAPEFKKILDSRERRLAGPTAPPNGLFLWTIDYYRG
jgi:tRNA pseudouridine38-40 synthase